MSPTGPQRRLGPLTPRPPALKVPLAALLALVMVLPVLAPAAAQPPATDRLSYPEPAALRPLVHDLLQRADATRAPLLARYNATQNGDVGYALYLLDRAHRYADLNATYFALSNLVSYRPAAGFANASWEVHHRNLTGNATVTFVLARTDAAYQANQARYHALITRLHVAQGNVTTGGLPYLMAAARALAQAGNTMGQYPTFRSALTQRGGWNDTLVQGAISYSMGSTCTLSLASGLINASATMPGDPVAADRYPALVTYLAGHERAYAGQSGLVWFQRTFSSHNSTANAVFLAGVYAEENGTTAFNDLSNQMYKKRVDTDAADAIVLGNARAMASNLTNATRAGVDHPYAAIIVNAAFLATYSYARSSANQQASYQQVLPTLYGHQVAAKTLLDAQQQLTGEASSTTASGTPPGAVPSSLVVVAVLAGMVAVGVVVVVRNRRRP